MAKGTFWGYLGYFLFYHLVTLTDGQNGERLFPRQQENAEAATLAKLCSQTLREISRKKSEGSGVAHLTECSRQAPQDPGTNPGIEFFIELLPYYFEVYLYRKGENKDEEAGDGPCKDGFFSTL